MTQAKPLPMDVPSQHASVLADPPAVDLPPLPAEVDAVPKPVMAVVVEEAPAGFWTRQCRRLEAGISRLSTRNNFWHRVCSWFWLPLAFRSGITFHKGSESTFSAVLPFRRFNRNWYNAMAGGALLGNAEVAGGMFVFEQCGGNYTVVCKELAYKFLTPCHGPAVYRIEPREEVHALVATGGEFNITIDMIVVQMVQAKGQRERRVGTCTAAFHVTPKSMARQRVARRRNKARDRGIKAPRDQGG